MSHGELVERAERWLRGTRRCPVVVSDFNWWGGECPDAMGWHASGTSTLVECKASKSDFYADKRKPWRRWPRMGLGVNRFYLTSRDLVPVEILPEGWGLLEVRGKIIRVIREASPFVDVEGLKREIRMLANINQRLSAPTEPTEAEEQGE